MLQFYIPWEEEGGYDKNLNLKQRNRTLRKNSIPGLVFLLKKSWTPVPMIFFSKVNNMKW